MHWLCVYGCNPGTMWTLPLPEISQLLPCLSLISLLDMKRESIQDVSCLVISVQGLAQQCWQRFVHLHVPFLNSLSLSLDSLRDKTDLQSLEQQVPAWEEIYRDRPNGARRDLKFALVSTTHITLTDLTSGIPDNHSLSFGMISILIILNLCISCRNRLLSTYPLQQNTADNVINEMTNSFTCETYIWKAAFVSLVSMQGRTLQAIVLQSSLLKNSQTEGQEEYWHSLGDIQHLALKNLFVKKAIGLGK